MIIFIVYFLDRPTPEIVSKFVETLALLVLVNTEQLSANMANVWKQFKLQICLVICP